MYAERVCTRGTSVPTASIGDGLSNALTDDCQYLQIIVNTRPCRRNVAREGSAWKKDHHSQV